MDRDTLSQILQRAPGVQSNDERFDVAEDHRLTFLVGDPGRAMQLGPVAACMLDDAFVELSIREDNSSVYVAYDTVHAVSSQPVRSSGRAGFA